jgi:hypothetical protein
MSQASRVLGLVLALLMMSAGSAAGALRIDDGNGGSSPAISSFTDVTLNGTPQLATASIAPFTIIDDSGGGAGWNLTLQIPTFQNGTGVDCATGATASVDATTLSMDAPVVAPADGGTSMTGVTAAGYTNFTAAQTIVDATAGNGAGTYTVAPAVMKFTVPADTLATTYCTEVTLTLSTGP